MELRSYLTIMRRYWPPLVIIPLIAALIGLGASFVLAPRYVSVATVQLIPDGADPRTLTVRNQEGASNLVLGLRDPTELLSQGLIETVRSRQVVEMIVDDLQISQAPPPQGLAALKAQLIGFVYRAWAILRFGYVAQGSERDAAVARVANALKAELVRGSYYMKISATWNDPLVAAEVANAAIDAIMRRSNQIANQAAAEQRLFLEGQVADVRLRVAESRQALLALNATSGVIGGVSLEQALNAREAAREALRKHELDLAATSAQLQAALVVLAETPPQIVTDRTVAGSTSSDSGAFIEMTSPNPVWDTASQNVQQLEQEVAAIETREWFAESEFKASIQTQLADARRRLQIAYQQQRPPNKLSPLIKDILREQVLVLEQQVAALESMLSLSFEEMKLRNAGLLADARQRLMIARQQLVGIPTVVQSSQRLPATSNSASSSTETSAVNPVYQELQQQTALLAQQESALQTLESRLAGQLAAREGEVIRIIGQDGQLATLNQELTLASDLYARRTTQLFEAMLDEVRPLSQIREIDPAAPPPYPQQPIKYLWTLIGLAAGLVVAMIVVFVRHNTNLALFSADEAQAVLELPPLAVMPISQRTSVTAPTQPWRGRE